MRNVFVAHAAFLFGELTWSLSVIIKSRIYGYDTKDTTLRGKKMTTLRYEFAKAAHAAAVRWALACRFLLLIEACIALLHLS